MSSAALDALRQQCAFLGGEKARSVLPTGFEALDRLLPGGGWPLGALTEVFQERIGVGEVRFLMPGLARVSRKGRWNAWISPPHLPYAPTLAHWGVKPSQVLLVRAREIPQTLWAAEQALGSGACGAVLAWVGEAEDRSLRRLQLAAEKGRSWGLLFRPARLADRPSPALLRLNVDSAGGGRLVVRVLKGRAEGRAVLLSLSELPDSVF